MQPTEDIISRTLDALERLTKMFAFERILYLLCAIVSFILLVFCLISLFKSDQLTKLDLAMIFGSSGLIAISAFRVSFFLNKSFDLVSKLVEIIALDSNNDRL